MDKPAPRFAVVHHPATQGHPRLLGRTSDPNEATLLLDREMDRLRKQGRDGEVHPMRTDPGQAIILRLPLRMRRHRR
jgi:hypothetical protein